MSAFKIFSRFAELLDIKTARAAPAWLRLNADGTVSERTAAQTLADLGAIPELVKRATSDVGKSLDATTAADTEIAGFALDANGIYQVDFAFMFTASAGGVNIRVTHPALIHGANTYIGNLIHYASGAFASIRATGTLTNTAILTASDVATRSFIQGQFKLAIGAAGGVLDFHWAQLSSNAATCTRHLGSWASVRKMN